MSLAVLLLKGFGQARGAFEQDFYAGGNRPFCWVPVLSYCTPGDWYFEARGNYEAINSASLYVGKTFEKKGTVSYSVTPMAGLVTGSFNGGSVGANVTLDYKNLSFSSQSQYTGSILNPLRNFTYSWSDLTYEVKGWVAAGASVQQTRSVIEKGILLTGIYKNWSIPLYVFNPASCKRYFVLGLIVAWGR